MKRVPVEQAMPGMVLAKPVTNAAGLVIITAGMTLDEQLITHLQRMGTAAIFVEGVPGEGESKSVEDLERELTARFRKVEGDPQLSRIREAIRRHLNGLTEVEVSE